MSHQTGTVLHHRDTAAYDRGVAAPMARGSRLLRWGATVLATGLAAGLLGMGMSLLLDLVQSFSYGAPADATLLTAVAGAAPWRRLLVPVLGGLVVGLGWWRLRTSGKPVDVKECIVLPARMGLRLPFLDALLQLLAVGTGASVGREGAPRLAAAATAEWVAGRLRLDSARSREMIAAGAGAGLAAVYNVPLAGITFALGLLPGRRGPRAWVTSVLVSAIATVVAWPVVGNRPQYLLPPLEIRPVLVWWALAAIPATALVGGAFGHLARRAVAHRTQAGPRLPLTIALAGAVLGVLSLWLPMLPGNGKEITQLALDGYGSVPVLVIAILVVAKPLVTVVFLRSGVSGGMITPALAVGATLGVTGALAGHALGMPGSLPAVALLGACGVLATIQRAPVFATLMVWELTGAPPVFLLFLALVAFGSRGLVVCHQRFRSTRRSPSPTSCPER